MRCDVKHLSLLNAKGNMKQNISYFVKMAHSFMQPNSWNLTSPNKGIRLGSGIPMCMFRLKWILDELGDYIRMEIQKNPHKDLNLLAWGENTSEHERKRTEITSSWWVLNSMVVRLVSWTHIPIWQLSNRDVGMLFSVEIFNLTFFKLRSCLG